MLRSTRGNFSTNSKTHWTTLYYDLPVVTLLQILKHILDYAIYRSSRGHHTSKLHWNRNIYYDLVKQSTKFVLVVHTFTHSKQTENDEEYQYTEKTSSYLHGIYT